MKFNIGIKAAIVKGGKLLVVRSAKGYWDLPGGRIDGDETFEATLHRELAEELPTITNVRIGELLAVYRKPTGVFPDGTGLALLTYKVEAIFTNDKIMLSDEHIGYEWMSKKEVLGLDTEYMTNVALKIRF